MENIDTASFRYQILEAAKRFKANWIDLAKLLYTVKKDKLFKEWGYISFDSYCTKEIRIRKQTAFKLLSSYYFLTHEEPQSMEDTNTLPNYEAINILRRARQNRYLKGRDYDELREAVFGKASEPREVGRQYRSMLALIKQADPEKERMDKRIATIKRLLSTLKSLRKEMELLKLLPLKILKDTDRIISFLEEELKREPISQNV